MASSYGWLKAAYAQSACCERDEIVEHLATKYHETLTAQGLKFDGILTEIFVSPDGTLDRVRILPVL